MKYEIIMSAPPIIRDFLTYNETIKGKSSKSVEEYYHDLVLFYKYLIMLRNGNDAYVDLNDIDISGVDAELAKTVKLEDLYSFLVYCKEVRNNNPTTRARKSSTLRNYFKYLSSNVHIIDRNPAELLDSPTLKKTLPKHLTLEESVGLLNSVGDGKYGARDYCILTLFLNCGMRLSELCSINTTDIKDDRTLKILGKGNKERIIYLNDACIEAINEYLKVRDTRYLPLSDKNALFISRNNRRISNKTVQHLVKTYLSKAGLDGQGFSTHKLRHTAATLMYQYGNVDIRVLKDILGHANLGTTQIYTHVADNQVENAIQSNPLNAIKNKKKSDE